MWPVNYRTRELVSFVLTLCEVGVLPKIALLMSATNSEPTVLPPKLQVPSVNDGKHNKAVTLSTLKGPMHRNHLRTVYM